jgi:hypothetical protein
MKQVRTILFISSVTLPFFLLTFLHCQHFSNPFENYHNADVHILPNTTFSTEFTDTLTLFSNDTLYLTTTVPELIDSFNIKASENRFFSDTTIVSPTSQIYAFRVSAYNIGKQTITIVAYREDKSSSSQILSFYVKNQLFQKDLLNQNIDDSLTLKTVPAEDNIHVVYTWVLQHMVIRTPFPEVKIKAYLMDNAIYPGTLFISDSMFKSPETSFYFSFNDTVPPVITCINIYDTITRTIITPDTFIVFRVQVDDGRNQKASHVSFNGEEIQGSSNLIYSKVIYNIKPFTKERPLSIAVQAVDKVINGNVTNDTFNIIHDPTAVKHDSTLIFINKISTDSLKTSANPVIITGSISNSSSKPVILKGFLNTVQILNEPYPDGNGSWTSVCKLSAEFNDFVLEAYDNSSNLLARRSLIIYYNSTAVDKNPPVVLSIDINGIESKKIYVHKDTAKITLLAFDYGSGIKKVTFDDVDLPVSEGQYRWTHTITGIKHDWNPIIISLEDANGNLISDSVQIKYNRLPTISVTDIGYAIKTDTTYTGRLSPQDPDNDTLQIIPVRQPLDIQFSEDNQQFTWTPSKQHTGVDTLAVVVYDKYEYSEKLICAYNVFDPTSANASIRISKQQNIPSFLIADRDTLHISTKMGEPSGTPPYTYQSRILTRTKTFEYVPKDGVTIWSPSIDDTGSCQIRLIVTDILRHSDTLNTPFLVIPPNTDTADLILKSVVNATIVDSSTMTLNLEDSTCLLNFEIRDSDHPLTEKYHATSTINNSTTSFTPSEKQFQIKVNGSILIDDTVIVTLKDSTRLNPDTLQFIIVNIIESPTLINDLARWYLPINLISNFFGTTWKDYANSTNDLYGNGDITNQPNSLNGLPVIKLSSASFSNFQGGNWMSNQFSIYIVARYDSIPGNSNQALIANFTTSYPGTQSTYSLGLSQNGEIVAFTTGGGPGTNAIVKASLFTRKQNWYIFSFASDGPTINQSITINTGLNYNFSKITTTDIPDRSSIAIGTNNSPGNKWAGEIAEIIQYNRNLNSLESKKVIGYLMNKYGLK